MATYLGTRGAVRGYCLVIVSEGGDIMELPARLDLVNHSPTGFEWGYGGSGPAQLALAILAHHTRDDRTAIELHQQFKWDVIARLDKAGWNLTADEIDAWFKHSAAKARHA